MKKIRRKLISLEAIEKKMLMILFDSIALILVLLISFSLRYGYIYFPELKNSEGDLSQINLLIISIPFISISIFSRFGLYKSIIRYIGFGSLGIVIKAVSLYAFIWGLIAYTTGLEELPRSAILINWILAMFVIGGSRIFARWYLIDNTISKSNIRKVVIYGAGSAGRQLSVALNDSLDYSLMAFFDDSESMHFKNLNQLEVYPSSYLERFVVDNNIDEVLLAIPSIGRKRKNEIIKSLSQLKVSVRIIPSLTEIAKGKVRVEDLREIEINDLLQRDAVKPNQDLLSINISNKVIMVTGAGGSIGSELCRQILKLKPKFIVLYEINEFSLYKIEKELCEYDSNTKVFPILGSILNRKRISDVCSNFKVETIYHAAAYKHVPLVEHNSTEGVLNNIFGTLSLAEIAIESNVKTFVFVSSDKAVRPTNTMGASKRVAELILQAFADRKNETCFTMVRFGNVIESSGSVIPLFKKQIKDGGPVTVTDINMVRYFMTIPEAVELIIQAGAMSNGGDVFVLDMGEPIRIDDLAKKMIILSGLTVRDQNSPEGDIEILYTGLRPGEKLYEELLVDNNVLKTLNPLIMSAEELKMTWSKLKPHLADLEQACNNSEHEAIREILIKLVPEFEPQCEIQDYLYNV
jgi:UDP-N-acetylglucosamine 4,6-dehydratase